MGIEFVGVGFPNPLGEGPLPTMDTAPPIVPHLAPEGRHVYRTHGIHQITQSPRGATSEPGGTKIGSEQPKLYA